MRPYSTTNARNTRRVQPVAELKAVSQAGNMPGSRRSHCPPQSPRAKTLRTGLISCLRLAVLPAKERQCSEGSTRVNLGPGGISCTVHAPASTPRRAPTSRHPMYKAGLNIAFPPPAGSSLRYRFHSRAHLSGARATASADLPAAPSASHQLARLSRAGGLPGAMSRPLPALRTNIARLLRPALQQGSVAVAVCTRQGWPPPTSPRATQPDQLTFLPPLPRS